MTDYTKSTYFTAKDTLPTGDNNKKVKGAEIDTELNNITTAVNSKANIASPTLTGLPAAPTASSGTNTTQLATTAFVTTAVTAVSSTLGTMSTQNKTAVDITGGTITGGTITGITDLLVADGGTGASALTLNNVILGNGTSSLANNTVAPGTAGNVLRSNGTTWASASGFTWNTTYVNTAVSSGGSYTLPANCIGVYVWCTVYGGGNNGGIGIVRIRDVSSTVLGTVYINGTNIGGGTDGGSGMNDGAGAFVPVSSTATSLSLDVENNAVSGSFIVQAYVTSV